MLYEIRKSKLKNKYPLELNYPLGTVMVEMAGVEPASERIDPRIYYECSSFIGFILRRKKEQNLLRLFTQTRKPSFVPCRESMDSILTL